MNQEAVNRGERAERLYNDELFQEALQKIEDEITQSWKTSPADDEKGRYNAYLMHRLLQNFKSQFVRTMATGKAAKKELLKTSDKKFKF